jgi:hypothetical protein
MPGGAKSRILLCASSGVILFAFFAFDALHIMMMRPTRKETKG